MLLLPLPTPPAFCYVPPMKVIATLFALYLAVGLRVSHADLLAYDPFLAGGATPNIAAGEYQTGTGYTGDFIRDQGPATLGFVGTNAWSSGSAFASNIYYRNEDAQLSYTDSSGRTLDSQQGQLNLFRASNNNSDDKNMVRNLDIGASLPEFLYISLTLQITDGAGFTLRSASTDGNASRRFNFGIDTAGHPFTTGTLNGNVVAGSEHTNSNITINATENHFLVARLHNTGFTNDELALYLDPQLENENLNSIASEITVGNFYVGSNGSWSLQDIFFQNIIPTPGSSIVMDELRIGTTWADVTPHSLQIPEPSSLSLILLGLVSLYHGRRSITT